MNEKAQERREAILEAATSFFSEIGYRNTDVQQIADRLTIGKGTVYRYFLSKEALFFAAVDRAIHKMEEYIRSKIHDEKNDVARIRLAIRSYIEFYQNNPQFVELLVQERAEFRRREISSYLFLRAKRDAEWKGLFRRLYSEGKIRISNFDRVIEYVTNGLYGIMFTHVFQKDLPDSQERTDEALDMLLYGIIRQGAV